MRTHIPRRLVVGGVVLGVVSSLLATPLAVASTSPVDGVWRTDGYGTVVAIADGVARQFHTTSVSCLPGPVANQVGPVGRGGTVQFADERRTYTVRARHGHGVLHLDGSVGDVRLRKLPRLPDACTQPPPAGPQATFDVFWTTYAENYPLFAAKGIDWNAVRDRYRPRVRPDTTNDELFDILVEMIQPLGDAHTGVEFDDRRFVGHRPGTTFPTEELEAKVRPFIERRNLGGRELTSYANGLIQYADLPGRIGYLRILTFFAYGDMTWPGEVRAMDAALDAILTRQRTQSMRGLIIDLRINGGGSDALGVRLASRLTNRPYLAYFKHARNDADDPDRFTRPQPIVVTPSDKTRYTGPLVILTGGSQISAGETFTQAMIDRSPRPTRVGENTQGVFSDVLERSLPNGFNFIVPNEEFRTRTGRTFDGTGIPPHIRTPVFTDSEFATNRDSAFDTALTLLTP
jgi:hypothetical protein